MKAQRQIVRDSKVVQGPPFVEVLTSWMTKHGHSRRDVAHIARVSEKDVAKWERSLAVPTKQEFSRLCAAHYQLAACTMPTDAELVKAQTAEAERRAGESAFTLPPEAIAAATAAAEAEMKKKKPFHRGLSEARIAEKLTMTELADVLSIDRRTVGRWESGENVPNAATYAHLLTLLPSLADAEPPAGVVVRPPVVNDPLASNEIVEEKKTPPPVPDSVDAATTQRVLTLVEQKLAAHPHHVLSTADAQQILKQVKVGEKIFNRILRNPPLSLNIYRAGFGSQGVWYWSRYDFRNDEAIVAVLRKPSKDVEPISAPAPAPSPLASTPPEVVVANRGPLRLSDGGALNDFESAAASRALREVAQLAPIKLPFVPSQFHTKRYVPDHAVNRFRERYLYEVQLRLPWQSCVYLIDWLVERSIEHGYYEWVREGTEKLRIVGCPGLRDKQVFLFLVRENQSPPSKFEEVILTCLPEEDNRSSQINSDVIVNMPFAALAREFREIHQRIVPTRKEPEVITIGTVPTEAQMRAAASIRSPAAATVKPSPAPAVAAPQPALKLVSSTPPPMSDEEALSDNPEELGLLLGKAIHALRELRADLVKAKKLLDEKEASVERMAARVKQLQDHLMSLG